MTTLTEIKPAIARSISHNEIVTLKVADPKAALESIDNDESVTDLDWTEVDDMSAADRGKIIDVWGKRLGGDFRLYIVAK
jgi:flavin-binding protein dodecin